MNSAYYYETRNKHIELIRYIFKCFEHADTIVINTHTERETDR